MCEIIIRERKFKMAGALIHLAMGNPEHLTSKNCAYVIGILLPDIARTHILQEIKDGQIILI